MIRLRPFVRDDAEEVAALQARAFPESVWPSTAARAAYFREALLDNPWVDPELPSWVAEDGGRLAGFFGVVPRRMRFGDRVIRAAASCQFMVDPEKRRSFVALELMRKFLSGPQAFSVADGANDATRRLWEAAGGIAAPQYSLHWVRLLRPARMLLQRRAPAVATLGAPLAAVTDGCLARLAGFGDGAELREERLDSRTLLAALDQVAGPFALRPDYDLPALEWMLGQLQAKKRNGPLQACLLREPGGAVAGWFLYYLNRATSQVMHLGARPERLPATFGRLLRHAWERGASALEGRLEPQLAGALGSGSHCLVQNSGVCVLLHARDPRILVSFLRGDAFFTRLDGEWWMRFLGDSRPAGATGTPRRRAAWAARWRAPGRRSPAAVP